MAGRSERRIVPLSPANIDDLPSLCRGCAYWESTAKLPQMCGVATDPFAKRNWIDLTTSTWGECGRLLYVESEVVAHATYGPATSFPQTAHFDAGPVSADAAFLSCLLVREDARHLGVGKTLLQSIEKELYLRRVKAIEAFTRKSKSDEASALGPIDFYFKNGFRIERDHPTFPLVRLDLKTAVSWQENLEAVLQSLTIPRLRARRVPAPSR